MKVLILSRSMGGGHNTAAKAMCEAFERRGVFAEMVDGAVFTTRFIKDASSYIYVKSVQRTPRLFGAVYKLGEVISTPRCKSVIYLANHKGAGRMFDYIKENGFDAVVSPHLYPIETLTYLKRKKGLKIPCFGIATDYTCIPFWEDSEMDLYFIPSKELEGEYLNRKMDEKKLIPTGIPVSAKFKNKIPKEEAKRKLGLDESSKYYLVMSGSMGAGNALEISQNLLKYEKDCKPIVICGNNARLYEKMKESLLNSAVVVGFTDKIELYMNASEAVFTKAGGLTSTEAAVFGIPLVHTSPIPGCETENTEFFTEKGMSIHDDNPETLVKMALKLTSDPSAVERMVNLQAKYINKDGADDIADAVIKYVNKQKDR